MKICFVTGYYVLPPVAADSAGVLIHNYAYWMAKKGHQLDVLAVRNPKSSSDYNFVELHTPPLPHVMKEVVCATQAALYLSKLLSEKSYDAIHFYGNLGTWLSMKIAGGRTPPTVISAETPELGLGFDAFRNGWPRLRREFIGENWLQAAVTAALYLRSLKSVSTIIVDSDVMKKTVIQLIGLSPERVIVVPNGADTSVFRPGLNTSAIRRKHGIEDGEMVVLTPARIAPYKNQMAVLKTLPLVAKKVPNVKYVFAGPLQAQSYYLGLMDFANKSGFADRVVFTGLVDNRLMHFYYNLADVMVQPSLTEGHPLTLIEGMSCGRAIIASDIAQMSEHVKGDEYLRIDCNDTPKLAAAITTLLLDDDLRRRMGEAARAAVLLRYDWSKVTDVVLQIYHKLTMNRG